MQNTGTAQQHRCVPPLRHIAQPVDDQQGRLEVRRRFPHHVSERPQIRWICCHCGSGIVRVDQSAEVPFGVVRGWGNLDGVIDRLRQQPRSGARGISDLIDLVCD
ncbi:hypothetical protein [Rhodococcus sp. (in: high G+C Gram-positive bacteria)]|uniref:hypothetical protein n=1 Tax=Rhodococcus sp. TaxID=1831 RepID=UPI003B8A72E1